MSEERLVRLSELLRTQENLRGLTHTPEWAAIWHELEQELLERLLKCEPTDDERRWRCQTSIEVARRIKSMFEVKGITPATLTNEVAYLDGSKTRPIA